MTQKKKRTRATTPEAKKAPRGVSFNLNEEAFKLLEEFRLAELPLEFEKTSLMNAALIYYLKAELAKRAKYREQT